MRNRSNVHTITLGKPQRSRSSKVRRQSHVSQLPSAPTPVNIEKSTSGRRVHPCSNSPKTSRQSEDKSPVGRRAPSTITLHRLLHTQHSEALNQSARLQTRLWVINPTSPAQDPESQTNETQPAASPALPFTAQGTSQNCITSARDKPPAPRLRPTTDLRFALRHRPMTPNGSFKRFGPRRLGPAVYISRRATGH